MEPKDKKPKQEYDTPETGKKKIVDWWNNGSNDVLILQYGPEGITDDELCNMTDGAIRDINDNPHPDRRDN